MTIQDFANHLKKTEDLSPLLQGLQALRRLSLGQLQAEETIGSGWNPWADGAVETRQALALRA